MNRLNVNRRDLKGLWIILIATIVIGLLAGFLIIKFGILNKFIEWAKENIIFSMLVVVPVILNTLTNMFYGFPIARLPIILEGITYNRILGFLGIYNGKKITDSYYASELTGVLGVIPTMTDTLLVIYYIIGLIYLYIVDGFFIFSPKIIMWAVILYALFFINVWIKSICVGKISASFDDIIYNKMSSKFYIIPFISGLVVILYYITTPIMILIGKPQAVLFKSTLINTITILVPFILPMYSLITARGVISQVIAFYAKHDEGGY